MGRYHPVNYAKFNVNDIDLELIKILESALNTFDNNSWLKNHAYFSQIAESIKILWNLDPIQSCWELVYCSNMNIRHYMDKIDDIMNGDYYIPTYNDVMFMPHSNISEISLSLNTKSKMNIVTMNGSKYSNKWLHSFDHVTGITFVVSLNDFDRTLLRQRGLNAMQHSLDLFGKIVNDPVFAQTPIILIFDGLHLFRNKINNGSSISILFNQYIDDHDTRRNVQKSLDFITKMFMVRAENEWKNDRKIYLHTTSHYGNNANKVMITEIFRDIQHIKVTKNLNREGLL